MTDNPTPEPEYELRLIDVLMILGFLTLWCITLFLGLYLRNPFIVIGSFIFVALAAFAAQNAKRTPYSPSGEPQPPSPVFEFIRTFPCLLIFSITLAVPTVGASGLFCYIFFLWTTTSDSNESGLEGLVFLLALILMVVLAVMIFVFGSISRYTYHLSIDSGEEHHPLAIIVGLLLGVVLVVLSYHVLVNGF